MRVGLDAFSFLVISIAGWLNQRQQRVIEYLIEENRVLREQIGNRRMRFNDNQRDDRDRRPQNHSPESDRQDPSLSSRSVLPDLLRRPNWGPELYTSALLTRHEEEFAVCLRPRCHACTDSEHHG